MQLTNNLALDKFLDDEFQCKGYVEAQKLVQQLRATTFRNFNDQDLDVFRKEIAYAFDMTLK